MGTIHPENCSQIYRRDGSVIWISENARAVHDEVTGELLYYEGMVQDITRRLAAEEARKQAEEKLVRYAQELRVKNAQFEADLEMARDIQQVFLTPNFPCFPRSLTPEESWLGFSHLYQPAEQVGGDFFCVLPLSDTEAGVFICDVLGHGLRAALVTAIVRGLLEELTPIATDPRRLLSEINGSLIAIFRQTETPMLVTAFYLVVNTIDGKMCYSNAGHPRPFHIHREIGIAEPLRFNGLQGPVLGIFPAATYPNSYGTASANDLVVLFTDGLFEVETADDEYYGADRLLAAVRKRMHLSARQLFGEVLAEIRGSCISGQFSDDCACSEWKCGGSGSPIRARRLRDRNSGMGVLPGRRFHASSIGRSHSCEIALDLVDDRRECLGSLPPPWMLSLLQRLKTKPSRRNPT
jgi:serine phosphatase RsbU (regulator of sigma subunit)